MSELTVTLEQHPTGKKMTLREVLQRSISIFYTLIFKGRGPKKIDFFLGKSPKLWVGGGQES